MQTPFEGAWISTVPFVSNMKVFMFNINVNTASLEMNETVFSFVLSYAGMGNVVLEH